MLDLTNGDILDAVPIKTSGFIKSENTITPRTVLSKPILKGSTIGGSIPRTIPTPIQVSPTISNATTPKAVEATTPKDEPKSAPKSSGGGKSENGGGSKGEKKEDKKEDKKEQEKTKIEENKIAEESFLSKHLFHGFLILGGVIGFFYAKKTSKNILSFTLLGAGIGGGLGYGIKSFTKKDTDNANKKEGVVINNDDDLIKLLIENMKQLVVSMATIMGQDKAKVEEEFNKQLDTKKDEIFKKSKDILSTLKDNEKKALGEILSYENSLYKTNLSNEKDAEKLNSDLDNKIQELSKKYSIDLKSVIEKLKQK